MKRLIIILLVVCLLMGNNIVFSKTNEIDSSVIIVDEKTAKKIEEKIDEINSLTLEKNMLNNTLNTKKKPLETYSIESVYSNNKQELEIDSKINTIKQEIFQLGAEEPSDTLIKQFLQDQYATYNKTLKKDVNLYSSIDFVPSELVKDFKELYDVYGYSTMINGYQTYHVIFNNNENCDDPYLNQSLYDEILWDPITTEQKAKEFLDDLVHIYVDKAIGVYLGEYNLLASLVPYELLTGGSKPSPYQVYSKKTATIGNLAQVTTQKFIYVYMYSNWHLGASTNKVNCAYKIFCRIYDYNSRQYSYTDGKEVVLLNQDYIMMQVNML